MPDAEEDLIAENRKTHALTSDLFLKLGLSYKFTSTLWAKESRSPCIQFLFSKPTKEKPVPEVVVSAEVRPLSSENDGLHRYSVIVEGQRLSRMIALDPNNITGNELNEMLINKVYDQKVAIMQRGLPT
ncbi:hypothetical protein DIPPA_62768 [Diplonema papillatum]|nr:hypothetical protein DIPPA_62768 [Diplonema papillatum]